MEYVLLFLEAPRQSAEPALLRRAGSPLPQRFFMLQCCPRIHQADRHGQVHWIVELRHKVREMRTRRRLGKFRMIRPIFHLTRREFCRPRKIIDASINSDGNASEKRMVTLCQSLIPILKLLINRALPCLTVVAMNRKFLRY